MDYTGLGSIRWFSLLLLGEPLAYRVNGDVQWAHLRPQRWLSSAGGIHPEGKVRCRHFDVVYMPVAVDEIPVVSHSV